MGSHPAVPTTPPKGSPTAATTRPPNGPLGGGQPANEDRVVTIPNLLSVLRLLGVPLFLWLVLGPHWDAAALGVLFFAGLSDYLDGKLARALNQTSRLGVLLDPLADRLYIAATLAAFVVRSVVPLWFAVALAGRDVVLAGLLPVLRRHGYGPPPVHFLGKAATFNLLYAFPLLLLGVGSGTLAAVTLPLGWAFAVWGAVLYWVAGVIYLVQVYQLVRRDALPLRSRDR